MAAFVNTSAEDLRISLAEEGQVWCSRGDAAPYSTGQEITEFIASGLLRDARLIQVLGTPAHARLLCALFEAKPGGLIQIGSPAICPTASIRANPALVLQHMRMLNLAPSVGGWHPMTLHDYVSYRLVSHSQGCTDLPEVLLKRHPAWSSLMFIPEMTEPTAMSLLATIIDPRWYVDPAHPDRRTRLFSYMGLTDQNMRAVRARTRSSGRYGERAQLVVDAWTGGRSVDDIPADITNPGQFSWRAWSVGGGGPRGMLRVSQRCLEYIRLTWLDNMSFTGDRLFVPEYFFTPAEAAAYRERAV